MTKQRTKVTVEMGWIESDHSVANPTINRSVYQGRPTDDKVLLDWTDKDRELAAAFTHTDPWRVMRIQGEVVAGFDALADIGPAISVFGSARSARQTSRPLMPGSIRSSTTRSTGFSRT